jgi:hypothetical protein
MAKKRQTNKSSFDARIFRVQVTFWRHRFRLSENALTKGHYRFPLITAPPKPVTRYCPLVQGAHQIGRVNCQGSRPHQALHRAYRQCSNSAPQWRLMMQHGATQVALNYRSPAPQTFTPLARHLDHANAVISISLVQKKFVGPIY